MKWGEGEAMATIENEMNAHCMQVHRGGAQLAVGLFVVYACT